jgi:hypothetical protein
MRLAIILSVLWLISSLLWVQYIHGSWRDAVDPDRTQISALDRCDPVYPPRSDGYAAVYGNSWAVWLATEQRNHPDCAPLVGTLGLSRFVAMSAVERLALRRKAESDRDSVTRSAWTAGIAGPLVLLLVVVVTFCGVRVMRSA